MSIKSIRVTRSVDAGALCRLGMEIIKNDGSVHSGAFILFINGVENIENEICYGFLNAVNLEHMKPKIIVACWLRDLSHRSENRFSFEVPVEPKEHLNHFSCKMNPNEDRSAQNTGVNEVSQLELNEKLEALDKDSKVLKFFEEKKCPVCMSSYKEILDGKFHIVVPSCGHPLCCNCADNVLLSGRKECPSCREGFTAKSFTLMKFNADLEIVAEDQKLFL